MIDRFKVTIKVERLQEDGNHKSVSENIVINASSHTEAEVSATKLYSDDGELTAEGFQFNIKNMSPVNFREVFPTTSEVKELTENDPDIEFRWFACIILQTVFDEDSGKSIKTKTPILIEATNFIEATKEVVASMSDSSATWRILSVKESNYCYVQAGEPNMDEVIVQTY